MLSPSVTEKVTTPVGNETGKHRADGEVPPTTSPTHLPPLTSNNTAGEARPRVPNTGADPENPHLAHHLPTPLPPSDTPTPDHPW
jgi:hypothetical protein